jgi:lipopolysaccharide biosynthesis regulator YciM
MYELLWLLLPVAAASGWLIGRRGTHQREQRPLRNALSADYFRGLNHLLNEQPDKAIEVFIRMLEAEGETAEIHLALGSLFRRRGEVDRAIRIHQNLIARPTLTTAQRGESLLELGLDYTRSGLYDRAEAIFLDLVEMRPHGQRALAELLDIYEQEKEWVKAIDTAKRLAGQCGTSHDREIAHYYCELADAAVHAGDTDNALVVAGRALTTDPESVRASLLCGALEARRGNSKAAVRAYQRVADQDPDFVPEIIAPLRDCYATLGRSDELRAYLLELLPRVGSIAPVLAVAEMLRERDGDRAAGEFIIRHLDRQPSLRGLERVIELSLEIADGSTREILQVLSKLVSQLVASKPCYHCEHCGFNGKTLYWRCPSCRVWGSVKPIQGIEGL